MTVPMSNIMVRLFLIDRYKLIVNVRQVENYYITEVCNVNVFPNFPTLKKQAESNLSQWYYLQTIPAMWEI